MNYKKLLIIPVLIVAVMLFGGAGCTEATNTSTGSYQNDTKKVEDTQKRVQNSVPIPEIKTSAERKNISDRAKLFDNEALTTYIYLVNYGKVMAFYPVKGKVSSLNSYLSPMDKLVNADGNTCKRDDEDGGYNESDNHSCYSVAAPDIDGAYGENTDGIFFFTADTGAYVEWKGDYMVSSQPLKLATPPELVREIK